MVGTKPWLRCIGRLLRGLVWLRADRVVVPFLVSFLLLAVFYRVVLTNGIEHSPTPILGSSALNFSLLEALRGFGCDALVGLLLAGGLAVVRHVLAKTPTTPNSFERMVPLLGCAVLIFLLSVMAMEFYNLNQRFEWISFLALVLPLAGVLVWRRKVAPSRRHVEAYFATATGFFIIMAAMLLPRRAEGLDWIQLLLWRSSRYLVFGLAALAVWGAGSWLNAKLKSLRLAERWPNGAACTVLGAALVLLAFVMFAHYHLLREFESGLTLTMLLHGWTQMSVGDLVRLIPPSDCFALLGPVAMFVALYLSYPRFARAHHFGALALGTMAVAGIVLPGGNPLRAELRLNPVQFFAQDAVSSFRRNDARQTSVWNSARPGAEQLRSVKLVDDAFISREPLDSPALPAPAASDRPWNILFFIMESTGAGYVFDQSEGNAVPMPFLRQLAAGGVQLKNHHSTAGTSAEGVFSLVSGLYPMSGQWCGNWPDNHQPALSRFLGPRHQSFFVHPASMSFAFPRAIFVNNGMSELYERRSISGGGHPDRDPQARNEHDAVSFLLDRVDSAREPFCAFYMSFVPHAPYSDYGPEYRIFPNSENERHRYYNNLRLLDAQIRRIHEHLAAKQLLDRTIMIFVGDHGEAFGQHAGVWKHGIGTYAESFRTPAVFWQPALFKPAEVTRLSSHVDVLPTLLDAMGVPFNDRLLQGESLFRASHRKFIFTTTKIDDYVTAIGRDGSKVSLTARLQSAYAYNLAKDPNETIRLPVANFPLSFDALLKFRNYQSIVLPAYSEAVKSGVPFHGERHPAPGQFTRSPAPRPLASAQSVR